MRIFSRFYVFVCVALLFAGGTVDVHAQETSLKVIGDVGRVYAVGDRVEVVFFAILDGNPVLGVKLIITSSGLTDVVISNSGTTDVLGTVTVKGTVTGESRVSIQAVWLDKQLSARVDRSVVEPEPAPVIIVVDSPEPNRELKIGDTFTQTISIENREFQRATLPLSAWQMDVVFDPLTFGVVYVTEGDFLESDGKDAYFDVKMSSGKISVAQDRTGQIANADPTLSNVVKALSPAGIALLPDHRGILLTIKFKVLAVGEEPLGIHNVQLQSDVDYNEDGALDRISYSILVKNAFARTRPPALEVYSDGGLTNVGDEVTVTFLASPAGEVPLYITSENIEVISIQGARYHRDPILPSNYTSWDGVLVVRGIFTRPGNAFIHAHWDRPRPADDLSARAVFEVGGPLSPTILEKVSGNNQHGESDTSLQPFVVVVKDRNGKALSGIDVAFRGTTGGGTLSSTRTRTSHLGRADTTLTLGPEVGIYQVEAYVLRFPSLTQTFTAAAAAVCEVPSPLRPTTLSIVSGNNQSGEIGKSLAQPFVVGVLDQDGKPLQGTAVTFTVTAGSGQISGHTIHTDVYGQARTTLMLGSGAGHHSVIARAAGIPQTQTFTATATAPPPPREEPEPVVSVQPSTAEPPLPPIPSLPVVYWIEEGAIFRLDGGNKQALVEPSDGWTVTSLAMDMEKNKLYWTERQTGKQIGRIWSGDLNDRNARELQSITAVPEGIVVDAENDRLYWTNGRGKIQSINGDGSNFKGNLIEGLGSPHHIALDGNTAWGDIYWTVDNEDGSWSIWRAPLVGNITKEEIVTGLDQLGGIAVGGDRVYWTEVKGNGGKIRSANKRNGSGVKILFSLPGSIPLGLVVDEASRRLYLTDNGGNIRSLNLNNPIETEIVVGGLDAPAVAIALGRSSGESIPASPAAPSTIAGRSAESALLANYPNPFNPETWIPYQLSASADVSVSIYAVDGRLVRWLDLGHQVAGVYRSRSRAAYWDGRNEFGERVASGLYFYTLTAGDFTATRKMLIRK